MFNTDTLPPVIAFCDLCGQSTPVCPVCNDGCEYCDSEYGCE